ncbi:MAG: glutaconyl-CoA decarboxylase subunit alpha [Deltaproteobacteria bacterium]|nr:glutaconyl-CoA decarboxylase subunit alpha [Deltaproteobacteria bacterium]MBW1960943.1 glutaconyl-CoA decarboxylase subunit alpha [Deltaproteobacteria bacterium]MBW1993026.1 glutaconyl-CoA decarboxylase subunit alpha [Deltaproteobacteria bacterium]MBW2152625.1 glutaconyl-CoA decarboxylase subunit alpha [Deltaproteobacteria bacterium]
MRPYFEKMAEFGHPLKEGQIKRTEENVKQIKEEEAKIAQEVERVKKVGIPEEKINARGQWTVWQRLEYLVDPGTWCPLHTIYNPQNNEEGTTNVFDGLGKISGKWAVIIGFDNKVLAGAWLPGQAENIFRVTNLSKRLNLPLVWLVNCSGVKLPEQEKFYADRRGSGATFFRHAELEQMGIPILAAIYGTNPAGGGYQGISPTVLFAHKNCNIAVGGVGILTGMSPKGYFDKEGAEMLIEAARKSKAQPPGGVKIHYDETGFFRYVYEEEKDVLDGLKDYMKDMPAYNPKFFRVADPKEPKFPVEDLYRLIPFNQKKVYDFDEVLARLVDGSEHMEFKPDYGPEVYTGLCKVDGFLVGIIGNRQGYLGKNYPEYADYPGIGGKLYRQGLIKMNEFVTMCGRDRVPIIWFQDTTGIDVGDLAEKAELLGLGQALIYSIQQTDIPMMLVVLRKGTAAAHYIMGGPTANRHNAFTLGTPTTEIYVMHGETAAVASYSRRLVKEKEAGRPLEPVIEAMNKLAKDYYDHSRPIYCAQHGLVDEVVQMDAIRKYMVAFAGAVYQNPRSICPQHQMLLPRSIKG